LVTATAADVAAAPMCHSHQSVSLRAKIIAYQRNCNIESCFATKKLCCSKSLDEKRPMPCARNMSAVSSEGLGRLAGWPLRAASQSGQRTCPGSARSLRQAQQARRVCVTVCIMRRGVAARATHRRCVAASVLPGLVAPFASLDFGGGQRLVQRPHQSCGLGWVEFDEFLFYRAVADGVDQDAFVALVKKDVQACFGAHLDGVPFRYGPS